MEYHDLVELVEKALEIDLANDSGSENTLKNSYVWVNLRGGEMLCKTEVYHSWCKDVCKEVRILNKTHLNHTSIAVIYKLIEELSELKYCELYGK